MSTSAPSPQTAEEALPPADDTVFDFGDEEDSSSAAEDDSLLNDESTIGQASQLALAPQHKMKLDGHGESVAKAQRKMKHDDDDDDDDLTLTSRHKNSLFEADDDDLTLTGRRKNSLLEASGSGSGPGLGSAKASSQSAALKTARANAISRRSLTAKKLLQAQQGKQRAEQQQIQKQEQQNLSTPPRTRHKTLKLETPDTLNTTLSSTPSPSSRGGAILTPAPASPPPPRARAYNRFFPPKKVETHDVEGTDSAICVEPDAATGEIELHIEEKIFMTNPVASVSEELFGASKWDQIAEMAKNQLDRKRGPIWSPMVDENEEAYMVADDRSVFSQKSLPSVLSNESIFHDTAVQAVASLLSLPTYSNNSPTRRSRYDEPTAHHAIPEGVSVDSDEETGSAISGLSGFSTYSSANKTRGMFEATLEATIAECDVEEDASVQSFITGELEEFIQSIPDRMITPTRQQLDIIAAIHTNGDEDSVPMTTVTTRGLMIRRMNACGVLKLLASKPANRAQLAWTGGILAALTSVLADSSFNYVDKATYNAFNVARERAVSALVCLSSDKTNRILMLHSPGLVHSLIKTVDEDDRECRLGCCVVLKDLSLAMENRRLLAQIPGLTEALLEVISGGNKDLITASLYESSPNENLHAARANAFAVFMNLTKERDNAHRLVRNKDLVEVLVAVSKLQNSPSHARALAVLVHFTRFRDSARSLVVDNQSFISIIANGTSSPNIIAQRSAVRSIQNISASPSCRPHILPNTYGLVERLCKIALGNTSQAYTEVGGSVRHSAVGALKNLADEPTNLMHMLKVTDCLPTLIRISHGAKAEGVTPAMALMAKDGLASFSKFYQMIVTEARREKGGIDDDSHDDPAVLYQPSAQVIVYSQWQ